MGPIDGTSHLTQKRRKPPALLLYCCTAGITVYCWHDGNAPKGGPFLHLDTAGQHSHLEGGATLTAIQ